MSSPSGPIIKRKNTASLSGLGGNTSPAISILAAAAGGDAGGRPARGASHVISASAPPAADPDHVTGLNSTPTPNRFGSNTTSQSQHQHQQPYDTSQAPPIGSQEDVQPSSVNVRRDFLKEEDSRRRSSRTASLAVDRGNSVPLSTANDRFVDTSKVKWAWSMDPQHPNMSPDGRALLDAHHHGHFHAPQPDSGGSRSMMTMMDSAIRNDLMDVVRLISTATIQTQTMEPSYTMTLGNVKMEAGGEDGSGGGRSIAVQAGMQLQQVSSGMQVVEADLVADGQAKRDAYGETINDEPLLSVGPISSMHSAYLPTCNVPSSMYPVFMNDARALGISNRYGYIALPKPPVELPARRRVKAVNPTEYPHLYGSHNPQLDEHTGRQLHRAHGLWASQCGFAPKY